MKSAEEAVLNEVSKHDDGARPADVCDALKREGFSNRLVRSVIVRLWDDGRLNFGADKKLRTTVYR